MRFQIKKFEDRRKLIEKYFDWVSVEYVNGKNGSKVHKISMKLILSGSVDFIEVESDINKKRQSIKNVSVYKLKLVIVGAEGFEPPTLWV